MAEFLHQPETKLMPTAADLEDVLRHHVINLWFPRCLDTVYGGFLCDFDRAWQPCGAHEKLLEFQARQTWIAAELLQFAPRDERLYHAAKQGFHFLRDQMWDQQLGGWFHRVNRRGEPMEAQTKHVHGMAYGINACVAVHTMTKEPSALDLACEAFAWLEKFSHDRHYGGYMGFLQQDGTIISAPEDNPLKTPLDTIGVHIGLKDTNVHSDLLETFTELYRVWPDTILEKRLYEVVDIMSSRTCLASGALSFFCQPDWMPIPYITRYGTIFQTASRLLNLQDLLKDCSQLVLVAQRLVDFCIRYGWDQQMGGFFYASPAALPMNIEGHDLVVRRKSWWVQFEALKALLSLSMALSDHEPYLRYFKAQWHYIQSCLLDLEQGGTYSVGLGSSFDRQQQHGVISASTEFTGKGHVWKDAYHDGSALHYCIKALRRKAETNN